MANSPWEAQRAGPEAKTFGTQMRVRRIAKQLSLRDLSELAHYSPGYLSKIENGFARPNEDMAAAIDRLLDADGHLSELIRPSPVRPRPKDTEPRVELPMRTEIFRGRTAVVEEVSHALAGPPGERDTVVVLYGLAGMGKTEIAVRAAESLLTVFPEACLFLDLHGHTKPLSPTDAMARILRRLGIPTEAIPHDPDDLAAYYRRKTRGRQILVVLDNAESVEQAKPLVPPGYAAGVIVTSRRRFSAWDEAKHVHIDALDEESARQLFLELAEHRAADESTRQRVDGLVDQIVLRCDRSPFPIRVAAGRWRRQTDLTLERLIQQLDNEESRFDVLDDGSRNVGMVLETAYSALPPSQTRLFALLVLHPGEDFDHRAVALLGGPGTDPEALMGHLLDACLVAELFERRYKLHDLMRSLAKRLVAGVTSAQEQRAAMLRLVSGYLHIAQHADLVVTPDRHRRPQATPAAAEPLARFDSADAANSWFEDEQDNLVLLCEAAVGLGQDETCWKLAYALRDFYFRTKRLGPWIHTHELALAAARRGGEPWSIAVTLSNLGLAYAETGDYERAAAHYSEGRQIFEALGDVYGTANALGHEAWILHCQGQHAEAIGLGLTALEIYERGGSRRNITITLRMIALAETALARTDTAMGRLDRALAISVEDNLILDEAMSLNCLGEVYTARSGWATARGCFERARRRAETADSAVEQARALRGLAAVEAALGDHDAADRLSSLAEGLHGGQGGARRHLVAEGNVASPG
jgi:tetratricopeptide (TPR) repeat protein